MFLQAQEPIDWSVAGFANQILEALSVEGSIWTVGQTYKPGDVVFAELKGVMTEERFQCRQEPFGNFCSQFNPLSQQGVNVWRAYDFNKPKLLPEPRQVKQKCVAEDQAKLITDFKSGDTVCQGQRYVYKCREVSGPDWCNVHQMGSEYAYLAWELIDTFPEQVETI